ncbi:MAG TPA: LptA/OstA family protein [Verrucomicrobiae bacterium]
MKLHLFLLLLVGGWTAEAQTNTPATNSPSSASTMDITSKRWDFDQISRRVVYSGDVRVTDPQERLTCEQLTVTFSTKGTHPENIQAETNVVVDYTDAQGEKYHVTTDKGVYVYSVTDSTTNETITLTGNARVEWGAPDPLTGERNWMTGEPIYYTRINRQKGSLHALNQHIHINSSPSGTNTDNSPVKLF